MSATKKVGLIFLLAVAGPSLALAWLAFRSVNHHQIVVERQQTLLYQGVCSGHVKDIHEFLSERQSELGRHVETLLADRDPQDVARNFDERILQLWPMAQVGFAVSLDGHVLSPSLLARAETKRFRVENDLFLSNQESVEVYWNTPKGTVPLTKSTEQPAPILEGDLKNEPPSGAKSGEKARAVAPLKEPAPDSKPVSRVSSAEAEFRQLVGDGSQGIIARFLQNRLKLLVWYRPPSNPGLIFGAQLNLPALIQGLSELIAVEGPLRDDICLALLDENAKPLARSLPEFVADWRHPFVSAEVGDLLPHWEVAAYLIHPARLSQSERTLTRALGFSIGLLLLAIAVGGGLLVNNLRRQLTLARQKTDFVSNVSHELKTPLTSIRMFSELLAENRVTDEAKRQAYFNIITSEVARLTRLINNVLDFARIERGEKSYHFQRCDLAALVRETSESYRPHLEAGGFRVSVLIPDAPVFVDADRDALAQVLVNLLSNAEKYSGDTKEVSVEVWTAGSPTRDGLPSQAPPVCSPNGTFASRDVGHSVPDFTQSSGSDIREAVDNVLPRSTGANQGPSPKNSRSVVEVLVLDRGTGVPRGSEEQIFDQFYRAHDSLSSGIQGAGLGLTLARQIARAHGGDVTYQRREGGGSSFVLHLPCEIGL